MISYFGRRPERLCETGEIGMRAKAAEMLVVVEQLSDRWKALPGSERKEIFCSTRFLDSGLS